MAAETPAPPLVPDPAAAFAARHRGRGDVYWWLLGVVGSVGWIAFAAGTAWLVADRRLGNVYDKYAYPALAFAVVSHLAYLFRRRWSRVAVLFPYLLLALSDAYIGWASARDYGPPAQPSDPFGAIRELVLVTLFVGPAILALVSPLNRLTFGLEVPRPRLEAAQVAYQRNGIAVAALVLSASLAVVPVGFVLPLPVALTAWWRSREPGVGHPRAARVALALCGAGLVWTVAFFTLLS